MRLRARPFRGSLLALVLTFGTVAVAQELQLDPKALDTSGASATPSSSVQTKRGKGKKGASADGAAAATSQQGTSGKPAGGPNRQFGELEGWSPGKEPPKPKDREATPAGSKMPVNVSPSGNMGAGFAF